MTAQPWHIGRDLEPLRPFIGAGAPVARKGGQSFTTPFRRALFEAHRQACAYCGEVLELRSFHVDHVTPQARGGGDDVANLVAACGPCNAAKRERDLEAFRWTCAVRFSDLRGIITAKQAAALAELGVALPVRPFRFRFEEWVEAME